jgi:hypothetical protein
LSGHRWPGRHYTIVVETLIIRAKLAQVRDLKRELTQAATQNPAAEHAED